MKRDKQLAVIRIGIAALAIAAGTFAYTPPAQAQTCQTECTPGVYPCARAGSIICLRSP